MWPSSLSVEVIGFPRYDGIPVAKLDVVESVALNVPGYAATLALYILITPACNDFYNFSSLSYHGNITYNKGVPYKLNETSEKTRGR